MAGLMTSHAAELLLRGGASMTMASRAMRSTYSAPVLPLTSCMMDMQMPEMDALARTVVSWWRTHHFDESMTIHGPLA